MNSFFKRSICIVYEPTEYASKMPNAYNVGVDVIGFEPKTFEEIVGKNE